MIFNTILNDTPINILPTYIRCIMPYGETQSFQKKGTGFTQSYSDRRARIIMHDGEKLDTNESYAEMLKAWTEALRSWLPSVSYLP